MTWSIFHSELWGKLYHQEDSLAAFTKEPCYRGMLSSCDCIHCSLLILWKCIHERFARKWMHRWHPTEVFCCPLWLPNHWMMAEWLKFGTRHNGHEAYEQCEVGRCAACCINNNTATIFTSTIDTFTTHHFPKWMRKSRPACTAFWTITTEMADIHACYCMHWFCSTSSQMSVMMLECIIKDKLMLPFTKHLREPITKQRFTEHKQ